MVKTKSVSLLFSHTSYVGMYVRTYVLNLRRVVLDNACHQNDKRRAKQILMYRAFVSSWPMKTVVELADGSILYVKPHTISIINSDYFPAQNNQIALSQWNENVVSARYGIFIDAHKFTFASATTD